MPDSQNKQGEQAHAISNTPRSDAAAYCTIPSSCSTDFARQLERELNTALSLLSQQHAPVSEIHGQIKAMLKRSEQYKREAENDGVVSEAEKHARVSSVLQELDRLATAFSEREAQQHAPSKEAGDRLGSLQRFDWSYHSGVFHSSEGELVELSEVETLVLELAAELTKRREEERVKHEAQLKAVKEDRDAILDDRDSLRQQLAEAKSEQSRLQSKLKADVTEQLHAKAELRAHNIALSAVVEQHRALLKQFAEDWIAGTDVYDFCQQVRDLSRDMLALQPDLSLYGRIVETLKEVCPKYGNGMVSVTQLLADLGQSK